MGPMTGKIPDKTIRHQHSVYYRSPSDDDGVPVLELDMFLEDISIRTMPIGGHAGKRPFQVTILRLTPLWSG